MKHRKSEIKNLTSDTVKRAKYVGDGQQRHVIWDSNLKGFGLQVRPPLGDAPSVKTFVVSYRVKGVKRLLNVGRYGVVTVAQAREEAVDVLRNAHHGIDPKAERAKQKQGDIFRALADKFIADYAKPEKITWKEDKRRIDSHFPKSWFSRRVADITDTEIENLRIKLGVKENKPYEANRCPLPFSKPCLSRRGGGGCWTRWPPIRQTAFGNLRKKNASVSPQRRKSMQLPKQLRKNPIFMCEA